MLTMDLYSYIAYIYLPLHGLITRTGTHKHKRALSLPPPHLSPLSISLSLSVECRIWCICAPPMVMARHTQRWFSCLSSFGTCTHVASINSTIPAQMYTHTHTRARRVSILFQCWKGLSVHLSCVNHSLYKRKCGNWDRGVCRVCIVPTSDTWYTSAPHSIQHSVLLVRYHPASPLWIIN